MLNVSNSPFNQQQVELLNQLLPQLTNRQQIWLTGYLSAFPSAQTMEEAATQVAVLTTPQKKDEGTNTVQEVTILYGSQTGNCQALAEAFASQLRAQQMTVKLSSMADLKTNALKKIKYLLLIVSTHGEGDPPDSAMTFYDYLHSQRAPQLPDLQYAVLALGDRSYTFFCQTGKDFDERFEQLGAQRILPRVDCDLDFDEPAQTWFEKVSSVLNQTSQVEGHENQTKQQLQLATESFTRTNPFYATVLDKIQLNGRGSNKETIHLELSLEGSGLTYEPGDSLGIYPTNEDELVDRIISLTNCSPDTQVVINQKGEVTSLRNALHDHFDITVLTTTLLEKAVSFLNEDLQLLLNEPQKCQTYLAGRDVLDLLTDFGPFRGTAQEFVSMLRKLPARLYSIASSFQANPEEVHLLIGTVRYEAHGRKRHGVCSVQCADRLEVGDQIPVYLHKNENFCLPSSPSAPLIMIGPGTGVAPFRSFLEEREELEMRGKTWLFFGEQHYVTDFYYQTEWQRWMKAGVLTRIDVAFSRDTTEKIYVQHRMLEQSQALFQWLEEGAYVYVCGDEKHMAKDVHAALLQIIQTEGGYSEIEAQTYIRKMQQQKRYQRDVY